MNQTNKKIGRNPEKVSSQTLTTSKADTVIKLTGVSKAYNLYQNKIDRLKEALDPRGRKYHKKFFALRDINLTVQQGESLGIMGVNGAGKSTLLKAITRIITPTSGTVSVTGHMSALLELGSGFNPEFTGYENLFFYGAVMGLRKSQMQEKIDGILKFADIGEYIYQPLKTYSSGMKSRLAFAVATSIDPDILILDEVLSVGDMFFQAKCTERMQSMIRNKNTTVLFVSHNVAAIKAICEKCILLQEGRIISYGSTADVTEDYFNLQIKSRQKVLENLTTNSPRKTNKPKTNTVVDQSDKQLEEIFTNNQDFIKRASHKRVQNGKAEFINCALLDENEKEIQLVEYGQTVILRMALKIFEDMSKVNIGYHIQSKGLSVLYASSITEDNYLNDVKAEEKYLIDFKFKLELQQGVYNVLIDVAVPISSEYILGNADFGDHISTACQFEMAEAKPRPIFGFVHIDNKVNIKKIKI